MAPSICVLVMTDGRPGYIGEAIASLTENLDGPITRRVIHDDSGDPAVHDRLRDQFPDWHLATTPGRSGFGGAYRHAWQHIVRHVTEPFVFSTEDDFTYNRAVNLHAVAALLDDLPHVAQVALQRQPWSGPEIEYGGVVGLNPDAYTDREHGGWPWLEHRQFWTTNPSLHRASICERGWPPDPKSEAAFAAALFADPTITVGYWGQREDDPWVTHIGNDRHRQAKGY